MLQNCTAALSAAMDKQLNEPRVPGQWKDYQARMVIDNARGGDLNIVIALLSVCDAETLILYEDDEKEFPELSSYVAVEKRAVEEQLSDLSYIIVKGRALM
jgi:hypothetical protein